MATKFLEPGGDADFGIALWPAKGGGTAPTAATDFVHGGHLRSIKYATSAFSYLVASNTVADAGGRVSVWIYLNALPSATSSLFQLEKTGDGSGVLSVMITSGGVLQLGTGDSPQTLIGTTGSTLSTGTWYRLCLAWTITSTTVNSLKLFKNGTIDISVTNATLLFNVCADLQVGNGDSTTLDMRTSDHYVDDSTALTDPGNIWVTAKRPNANGTLNQFTTQVGSGGSGYGTGHSPQVNERALSTTNGWSISTTTKQTEEYTIESAATGDINISTATIVDYMGWINAKEASTSNSPVAHIIVGGVATAITLTISNAIYKAIAGSTTYPSTGAAIGMDGQYTTTAHLFTLAECGIVIAYIPASGTAFTQSITGGLAFAGVENALTKKGVAAGLSFSGLIVRFTSHAMTSSLNFVGAVTKRVSRTIGAAVYFGRLNYVTNPSFETDTVGTGITPNLWTDYTSSGIASYKGPANDWSISGSNSFKITSATTADLGIKMRITGLTPGAVMTIAADIKGSITSGSASVVAADAFDGSGSASGIGYGVSDSPGRVVFTKTVPGTGEITVFLGLGSFFGGGAGTVWFDSILVEYGNTAGAYFDGSSAGASWTGTAHASTSTTPHPTLLTSYLYSRALTAGLSFVGSIGRSTRKALPAGLISLSGTISRAISKGLVTAVVSFAGIVTRATRRAITGQVSFSGVFSKGSLFFRTFSGSLSLTAAQSRQAVKSLSASLNSNGNIQRRTAKGLSGGVSLSGVMQRLTGRGLIAALNFTGTLAKLTGRAYTAALSFGGAIATNLTHGGTLFTQALAATVGFAGLQVKQTSHRATGGLSLAGTINRGTRKAVAGVLSMSAPGASSFTKQANKGLAAGVSFSGSIARVISKRLSAAASFLGSLTTSLNGGIHNYTQVLTASLSFTGAMPRVTSKGMTANASFSGTLARRTARLITASVSLTGLFVTGSFYKRTLTASITFAGSIFTGSLYKRTLTAALSLAGSIQKRSGKSLSGGVSFLGAWSRRMAYVRQLAASLGLSGSTTRVIRTHLTASVSLTGQMGRLLPKLLTSSLSFAGAVATVYTSFSSIIRTPFRYISRRTGNRGSGYRGTNHRR